jgi:hypothetical protein
MITPFGMEAKPLLRNVPLVADRQPRTDLSPLFFNQLIRENKWCGYPLLLRDINETRVFAGAAAVSHPVRDGSLGRNCIAGRYAISQRNGISKDPQGLNNC